MENPIRQLIQLIFDRASGTRAEHEVEESLKRAGARGGESLNAELRRSGERGGKDLAKSLGTSLTAMKGTLLATIGTAVAAVAVRLTQSLFEVASAAGETASKFATVFGTAANGMESFVASFANGAGMAKTEMRALAATVGSVAQGMGMSTKESAEFSQKIIRLSADLASFNNVPIAQTSAAITSALTGERESLKTLGIVISEEEVKKRALLDTGKKSEDQLTQEDKALTTLTITTEKAGVAVGDLERTKDSLANRSRELKARLSDLYEEVALRLLPVFGDAVNSMSTWLTENKDEADELARSFGDVLKALGEIALWTGRVVTVTVKVVRDVSSLYGAPDRFLEGIMPGSRSSRTRSQSEVERGARRTGLSEEAYIERFLTPYGATVSGRYRQADINQGEAERADRIADFGRDRASAATESARDVAVEAARARETAARAAAAAEKEAKKARTKAAADAKRAAKEAEDAFQDRARQVTTDLNRSIEQGSVPTIKFRTEIQMPAGAEEIADQSARERAYAVIQTTRLDGLRREAEQLAATAKMRTLNADEVQRALALEGELEAALTDQTFTLEQQLALREQRSSVTSMWTDQHAAEIAAAQSTAEAIANAYIAAFERIADEGATLSDVWQAMAQGMGAALLGGLREYAQKKVSTNIASAIEETAKGISLIATNPAESATHFAAAGKFVTAAVAWATAAGVSAAGGAVIGGGGRGAAPNDRAHEPPASERHYYHYGVADRATSEAARDAGGGAINVRIHLDPFDHSRAPVVETVGKAMETYVQLVGKRWAE